MKQGEGGAWKQGNWVGPGNKDRAGPRNKEREGPGNKDRAGPGNKDREGPGNKETGRGLETRIGLAGPNACKKKDCFL